MRKLICLLVLAAPSAAQTQPNLVSFETRSVLEASLLLGSVGTDQMPESSGASGLEAAFGYRILPEQLLDLLLVTSGRYLRTNEFEPSLVHGDHTSELNYDLSVAADNRFVGYPGSRFAFHLVAGPHLRSRSSMVLQRRTFGLRGGAHANYRVHPQLAFETGGGYLRHIVGREDDDGWYSFLGETRGTLDYAAGIAYCWATERYEQIRCIRAGYSGETSFFENGVRNINAVALGLRLEQ